ncbi:MAG: DUF4345 family protein [Gammaproteobacteria bacterium]|nr:DUF4345 family protein [Gammaproteobacteria bacterium]
MVARIFLGFQALLFIPYGLYCLVQPQMLSEVAGLTATTVTGVIELQAMYGGMQTAVGVLCALGAWVERYRGGALMALLFIFAGLAVPRVSLALIHGDFSAYSVFAMCFESLSLLFLLWLMVVREEYSGARVGA